MRKTLFACLICFVLAAGAIAPLNFTIPKAQGHATGVSLSAFALTAPTIDGTIEEAEWAAAASRSFTTLICCPERLLLNTIFVMNDLTTLYVAVRFEDAMLTGALGIFFDDDHDGLMERREDVLVLSDSTFFDFFIADFSFYTGTQIINPATLTANTDEARPGGTTDGFGASKIDGDFNIFEFSHPLCSRDEFDFCLSGEDVVGFELLHFDAGGWPGTVNFADASQWGDIVIAVPHTVLVLGSIRGTVGGWAFGAVEDSPGLVVYSVPRDILSFDREDTPDLVHLAMAAPTCTFPGQCIVETKNPDVTYTLSSDDTFTLTFELVSTRFVLEIPSAPFTLAVSCTVNLSSRTDRCMFSRTPDVNPNGVVDITDIAMLASAYESVEGSSRFIAAVDLNASGRIDITDIAIMATYYRAPVFK